MSKNLFILGAGASFEAGAPLMKTFLRRAEDLSRAERVEEFKGDFDLVLRARAALLATLSKSTCIDVHNMEAVFSAFEMGQMLGRLPPLSSEDLKSLPKAYRRVIVKTLEESVVFPLEGGRYSPPRAYSQLVNLLTEMAELTKGDSSIISFNYDMGLDYAIHQARFSSDYGLENPSGWRPPIKVFKLHGSLNWMICPKCEKAVSWHLEDFFGTYRWDPLAARKFGTLSIGSKAQHYDHCGKTADTTEPILVPPTWNKTRYHTSIEAVWRKAARELSDAENIFVIGYSLPAADIFFQYLFSLGVNSDSIMRRFWVFDPDGSVEPKYKAMLGESARPLFRYFDLKFSAAVPFIQQELSKEGST